MQPSISCRLKLALYPGTINDTPSNRLDVSCDRRRLRTCRFGLRREEPPDTELHYYSFVPARPGHAFGTWRLEAVTDFFGSWNYLRPGVSGVLSRRRNGRRGCEADYGSWMYCRTVACSVSPCTHRALWRSYGSCIGPGSRTPSADNHECWRTRYTPLPRRVATTPRLESGKCRDAPTAVCTCDRRRKSHNSLLSVSIRVQRAQSSTHHGFHHRPRNLRRIYLLAKSEVLDQTRGASSAKESVCCGSGESRSRSSDQG